MSSTVIILDEPELEFRYNQRVKDPHDGLALFGPYDTDSSSHPGGLSYILLGSDEGVAAFSLWADAMGKPATEVPKGNYRLWPPFPGFEAAFCTEWPKSPIWTHLINQEELIEYSQFRDPHERAYLVVGKYLEGLRIASKLDESPKVAICVVPDDVWMNCRPKSVVFKPIGPVVSRAEKNARKAGQLDFFESYDPEQYQLSNDFRRQLKARAMEFGIPIQIVRQSTLAIGNETRDLTPLPDRMWNLSTALYYKCGGKPWRLVTAREGVCYIGIAFRRTDSGNTACCAAQMFLNNGDGIVFLGEYGPWYSEKTKQIHLPKEAAKKLLSGILETYKDLGGQPLNEVFLHCRSEISDEEFSGYREACPSDVKLVGIRVRPDFRGVRLYRCGSMPVVRGSFWRINERAGLLFCSGFKPRLATYDGWENPVPLRIDVQYGDAVIERVAQDILGLTKLNYNCCKLGDAEPVTVGFSMAVGEILISNPTISQRRPNFKFYI